MVSPASSPFIKEGWTGTQNKRPRSPDLDISVNEERSTPRPAKIGGRACVKREESEDCIFLGETSVVDPAKSYVKRESSVPDHSLTPFSPQGTSILSGSTNFRTFSPPTTSHESPSPAVSDVHRSGYVSPREGIKKEWEDRDIENLARAGTEDGGFPTDTEVKMELCSNAVGDSESEQAAPSPDASGDPQGPKSHWRENEIPQKPKRKRRSPTKNPREYFQRQYEDLVERRKGKQKRQSKREKQMKDVFQSVLTYNHLDPNEVPQQSTRSDIELDATKDLKKDVMSQTVDSSSLLAKNNSMSRHEVLEAKKAFGFNNIKEVNGRYLHKAMKTSLLPHQLVGVARALESECRPDGARGGIIADWSVGCIGMGKTVEIIALIVANPPPSSTPSNQRATLIIVPKSLLRQWESEIEIHAGNTLINDRTMVYRAKEGPRAVYLANNDIVLTTYEEVKKSCPFPKDIANNGNHFEDVEQAKEDWIAENMDEAGLLHQHKWYRVVIDEVHTMKNHKLPLSHGCHALKTEYRWGLSGTPVMNSVEEFYSILRFLKVPDIASFVLFKNSFCSTRKKDSVSKLCELLAPLLIRRTLKNTYEGRPLIDLPPTHSIDREIKFTVQEKILYRAMEDKFRSLINTYLTEDDPQRNLSFIVVQLQALRQFTTHLILVDPKIKELFDIEELERIIKKLRLVGDEVANRLSSLVKQKKHDALVKAKAREAQIYADQYPQCAICEDLAEEPHKIDVKGCKHIFCETCIKESSEHQVSNGAEQAKCPGCSQNFDLSDLKCLGLPEPESTTKGANMYKKLRKGQDCLKQVPATAPSPYMALIDAGKAPFFASAKIEAVLEQVKEWRREHPNDKIIIFVQWRLGGNIIGRKFEDQGDIGGKEGKTGWVYYSGDMNEEKRELAVKTFKERSNVHVMIASLKCGGQGLNLAFANRVIILDLWWNNCVESQAFGRVHRIGQNKETHALRIIIRKTVDSRIYKLQKKKAKEIGRAMGDVTLEEMAGTLGRVVKDKNGRVVRVEADYSDDEDDEDDD